MGVMGIQSKTYLDNVGASKVTAATDLLSRIKKEGPKWISNLIENYCILTDAYISFSMAPTATIVEKKKTKDVLMSSYSRNSGIRVSLDEVFGSTRGSNYNYRPW